MGVLRDNAGVLGGIGQAMQTIASNKREERIAALQHEREMAIRKMENEHQSGENAKSRELTASEGNKNRQVEVGGQMRTDERFNEDRKSREREGAADRASAERIAQTRANAAAAGRSGSKKRWTTQKLTNENISKGSLSKTEDVVITDNEDGVTYKQTAVAGGDGKQRLVFLPQGASPPGKFAHPSQVQLLLENPDQASKFLNTYGYLPLEFMKAASSSGAEGASSDEEE